MRADNARDNRLAVKRFHHIANKTCMTKHQQTVQTQPAVQPGSPTDNSASAAVMPAVPSRGILLGSAALAALFLWSYFSSLTHLAHRWGNEADYTHGYLVPLVSLFLLWHRRSMMPTAPLRGNWWGVPLLLISGGMRFASAWGGYALLDPMSLLPCLAGVVLLLGGGKAFRWTWPSIAFLFFMIPLPGAVAGMLKNPLQRVATEVSTFLLQSIGIPAIARGNVIWLSHGKIGVVEACSGLRMLTLFFAFTVAAAFVVRRPLWEKIFVAMSAIVIGIVANVIRITATAVIHEYFDAEIANVVFHDLAGWLMMPLAMVLLILELICLSKAFVPRTKGPLSPLQSRLKRA